MKAVCVLRCSLNHPHGVVFLEEITPGGPLQIQVMIRGLSPGFHGFHVHRRGDETQGSHSLCDHYNPTHVSHGALNSPRAHAGDFGNLYSNKNRVVRKKFVAKYVSLSGPHSILGRSLVVHENRDDLGRGGHRASSTTGHSGKRVLWGIIGVTDDLPCK